MRPVLVASTALLLAPGAAAARQCPVPGEAPQPVGAPAVVAIPEAPAGGEIPKRGLSAAEIAASEELRAWAGRGAELYDLGEAHGLRGVFAVAADRSAFQVLYLTPDGRASIRGEMLRLAAPADGGRWVTRAQVRGIPGVAPTVDMRGAPASALPPRLPRAVAAPVPGAPARGGEGALAALEGAAHGLAGKDGAPRVWMVFDPLCPWSAAAMDLLRPAIEAGELQVALVPVPMLDLAGAKPNTAAALSLLAGPGGGMAETWRAVVEAVRAKIPVEYQRDFPAEAEAMLAGNWAAARRIGVRSSPTFLWRGPDGAPAAGAGTDGAAAVLAALAGG